MIRRFEERRWNWAASPIYGSLSANACFSRRSQRQQGAPVWRGAPDLSRRALAIPRDRADEAVVWPAFGACPIELDLTANLPWIGLLLWFVLHLL